MMWRFTWYTPGGTYTGSFFAFAKAIALSKAAAESLRPSGSAPNSSTLAAFSRTCGSPTFSESSRSMTVHAAALFVGMVSRILVPAG